MFLVDDNGYLKVLPLDAGIEIAAGNVTGASVIHKFGNAPDFDTGDGAVDIWGGADDSSTNAMSYTYSSTADIGILSSSSVSDTGTVEVQGLDSNWDLNVTTYTLNGTTDVDMSVTGTDLIRVFRMKNTGSSELVGDVYIRTNGSGQTSGVPNTANTVRAKINIGNNQTLMALYTIPNGKSGYLDHFYASSGGIKKSSAFQIDLFARQTGGLFQLKHRRAFDDSNESSTEKHYKVPEKFSAKTDITIRANALTGAVTQANISAGFDLVLMDE